MRREIGLVLQNAEDQLFNPTVLDDVAFGPLNLGLSPADARNRAVETLKQLGLHGFENRLTHRLSGGEKRLVSLATILSMRPKVLLLDEPTNGLDPAGRNRLVEILTDLPTDRIIISHDWDFLAQTTSAYLTIDNGRLLTHMPHLPHEHIHAHPLGDTPHHHHE
jgi:cobalt/nickel transport system ATP-binding protein